MKIKFGALVTDGRGKIGGHVASKNRSGAYLRTKVTPVNPQTSAQTAVRSAFGAFSQAWSGLSAALLLAWNSAVNSWSTTDIFGDLKNPTGKNLFLRLNQQATQAGHPSFTAVPEKGPMVEGTITEVNFVKGSAIAISGRYIGADARLMIFATPSLSQGTTFVKNQLRLISDQGGASYTGAIVEQKYYDKFGIPTDGANVHFGIKYVLPTGQASPMQVLKATVSTV